MVDWEAWAEGWAGAQELCESNVYGDQDLSISYNYIVLLYYYSIILGKANILSLIEL